MPFYCCKYILNHIGKSQVMFSFFKKSDRVSKHLADTNSHLTKDLEWQFERSSGFMRKLSQRYPNLWLIAGGAGATLLFLSLQEFYLQQDAEKEVKHRASQLAQAPTELKGDQAYNLPWTQNNLNEWLYKPVLITGRPRHSQAMLVPRIVDSNKINNSCD